MLYVALTACLGWVATACLFIWLLFKRDSSAAAEREVLRTEIRVAQSEITSLVRGHAEQLERITESHRKEVADLCQRIQAPETAVMTHIAANVPPDPPPLDLENDLALIEQRDRELRELGLVADRDGLL